MEEGGQTPRGDPWAPRGQGEGKAVSDGKAGRAPGRGPERAFIWRKGTGNDHQLVQPCAVLFSHQCSLHHSMKKYLYCSRSIMCEGP